MSAVNVHCALCSRKHVIGLTACFRRSQRPVGLRHRSGPARLLELWFRIPSWHGCLYDVNILRCFIETSVPGRSLVQRSPIECGVYECGREASRH